MMRLGLNFGYWGSGPSDNIAIAREAERLGYHSVCTAEAYGSDAVTPLVTRRNLALKNRQTQRGASHATRIVSRCEAQLMKPCWSAALYLELERDELSGS